MTKVDLSLDVSYTLGMLNINSSFPPLPMTREQNNAERLRILKPATTHGRSTTPEYFAWINMKQRCYNTKNSKYYMYGAKGIIVCERWLNSFENFLADMGERPTPLHSIDRINSKGNYEASNCRWLDKKGQSINRPDFVKILELDGEKLTVSDWARKLGIKRETLKDRLNSGWSIEKALRTPTK